MMIVDLFRLGALLLKKRLDNRERLDDSTPKIRPRPYANEVWAGEGAWRIIHRLLGALVLSLGLINISLGVFLAVLPLAVWVVWYVYMSILVVVLVVLEILVCCRGRGVGKGRSLKMPGKSINKQLIFFLKYHKILFNIKQKEQSDTRSMIIVSFLIIRKMFVVIR